MCGRMNVSDHPGIRQLMADLGLPLYPAENQDLRPTQQMMALIMPEQQLQQPSMSWGIQPEWSKKLLINAQSESVAIKPTFKDAFLHRRCLIPCTGWYEWRTESAGVKNKYLFTQVEDEAFLMAGLWFPSPQGKQLVTLTTAPNKKCHEIHHRMPSIIHKEDVDLWFNGEPSSVKPLLGAIDEAEIKICQQQAPSQQFDLRL